MTYEQIEKAEPAILTGVVTSITGFLVLLASDFSTLHSAAVAFGSASTQAFLTRPTVYCPKSIEALGPGSDQKLTESGLIQLLKAGKGFTHPNEPTVTIGVLTLLGSFLVQVFSGVDFLLAFSSAVGISGVQTAATRARVSSPATAREALACRLIAAVPPAPPDAQAGNAGALPQPG